MVLTARTERSYEYDLGVRDCTSTNVGARDSTSTTTEVPDCTSTTVKVQDCTSTRITVMYVQLYERNVPYEYMNDRGAV